MKPYLSILYKIFLGIGVTCVIVGIKYLFSDYIGNPSPYLLLALGVFISSFAGDNISGLTSTFIGTLLAAYFFTPFNSTLKLTPHITIQIIANLIQGILIVWIIHVFKMNRQKIKEQAELLHLTKDAIMVQDEDNTILFWSKGAESLYGYSEEEAVGKIGFKLMRTKFPESLKKIQNKLLKDRYWSGELAQTTKNGNNLIIESNWSIVKDEIKHGLKILEVNRDITKRKQLEKELISINLKLEEKVIERTKKLNKLNKILERSNRELQEFAYIASHDLQEPLRKVQSFGNLLLEEDDANLSKDGKSYLHRILDASTRMRTLIEDLLLYSRVTTKAQPFNTMNLNDVAQDALSILESRINEVNGKITIDTLPELQADRVQMTQLFQNLLSNSLKFHRKDTPPVIHVYSTFRGNKKTDTITKNNQDQIINLYFEDNGIGIDKQYFNRIFNIFERLNAKKEFEGTGIGLAIVKKIVERHKGFIKVKSNPAGGTTFVISLPRAQKGGDSDE